MMCKLVDFVNLYNTLVRHLTSVLNFFDEKVINMYIW